MEAAKAAKKVETKKTCTFPGCNRPHTARGLCKKHYQSASWHGKLDEHPTTLKVKTRKKKGRVVIPFKTKPGNVVREEVVVGQFVGTKLRELAGEYFLRGEDAIAMKFRSLAKSVARS